ncbi:MAG: ABC transporter ATP-binding protein [Flavobacteriaceae bacterium]
MNSILKISNLKIGYKTSKTETVVAQDISFSLEKGKLVALVGANGIGKSTLLKTILGFEKPIEGTILLNDKNISEISPKELARYISVVLTEKLPPSNLSVYELIALGRQPYTSWVGELSDIDKEKIQETITLTRLQELTNNKHFELSDGQHQKVMIARALAQDTEMMILDEPTTHLDLLHKISVFKLLKKLSEQTQKCVLFSTHDIDMAIEFCDEIIVMTPERTQKDTPQNLIENGIFDELFSSELVTFDKKIKKFIFI